MIRWVDDSIKRFKQTTTHYVWDANVPLHEYRSFDAIKATADDIIIWVFEEGNFSPMAKIKGDKEYSIVTDHLGTPILVGDEGFCNYLYQGQSYDKETGLAYNRFRYYDPDEGNYISQDPIGLAGGNPTLYGYVQDTNTWVDVFGLSTFEPKVLTEGSVFRGVKPGQEPFFPSLGDIDHFKTTGSMPGLSTKPKLNSQATNFLKR